MNELTPNVRRLFILRMSRQAIPDNGGLADGIEFFQNQAKRKAIMEESQEWVYKAISAIRNARDPNSWKDADDETIASEIVRQMDTR